MSVGNQSLQPPMLIILWRPAVIMLLLFYGLQQCVAPKLILEPLPMLQPQLMTAQDYVTWPTVAPTARLTYGPNDEQFGDLYIPDGPPPHPVLIIIHGGCW